MLKSRLFFFTCIDNFKLFSISQLLFIKTLRRGENLSEHITCSNAPLLELIVEVRWAVAGVPPGGPPIVNSKSPVFDKWNNRLSVALEDLGYHTDIQLIFNYKQQQPSIEGIAEGSSEYLFVKRYSLFEVVQLAQDIIESIFTDSPQLSYEY